MSDSGHRKKASPFFDHEAKRLSAFIRAEMLRRGLSRHDLAERTGYAADTVNKIICGSNRDRRERRKVEMALDQAFWTPPAEFSARRPISLFYGFDPALMTLAELDAQAAKHLPAAELRRPIRPRSALVARLESQFAAQSEPIAHAAP